MREMKDSGFSWIGKIPYNWSMQRVKHAFNRKNEKAMQENPVILSLARSGVRKRDVSTNEGQIAESYYNYNPVDIDDLLINPMDLYSGANCSISEVKGVISPAYINLRYKENINPRFYDYYFKVQYWLMAFFSYGKGVSYENRWTLNAETLMNYPIIVPPYDEQCRLAFYLDSKCTKIDSIIAKQQKIIEKLKEYKLSLITEAVTKGLNPDAKMRDSGVEWIGKIPEEWNVIKAKYCVLITNGSEPKTKGEIPVFGSGSSSFKTCGEFKEGPCVLIGRKGATLHIPHYIEGKYWNVDTAFDVKALDRIILKFYYFLAIGFDYKIYISQTTLPSMTQTAYENMILPIPNISEQHQIVDYLDKKCSAIDSAIEKKQAIIEKLTEYKKSLIYETVTGKKEVCTSKKTITVFCPVGIPTNEEEYAKVLLIQKIITRCKENLKGRVHLMKIFHALEVEIGFSFHSEYTRHFHGPYDKNIEKYESELVRKRWIKCQKGTHMTYRVVNSTAYKTDYNRIFAKYNKEIERIIDFFKKMTHTSKAEKVATLLASWNDFLIDGIAEPTDDMIITDVMTNWTKNKNKIKYATWQEILSQMKMAKIVPHGYGRHTIRMED